MLTSTTSSTHSESTTIREPITYSYDLEYLAQVQEETSTMSWYTEGKNSKRFLKKIYPRMVTECI